MQFAGRNDTSIFVHADRRLPLENSRVHGVLHTPASSASPVDFSANSTKAVEREGSDVSERIQSIEYLGQSSDEHTSTAFVDELKDEVATFNIVDQHLSFHPSSSRQSSKSISRKNKKTLLMGKLAAEFSPHRRKYKMISGMGETPEGSDSEMYAEVTTSRQTASYQMDRESDSGKDAEPVRRKSSIESPKISYEGEGWPWSIKLKTMVQTLRGSLRSAPISDKKSITRSRKLMEATANVPPYLLPSHIVRASFQVTPEVRGEWLWSDKIVSSPANRLLRTDTFRGGRRGFGKKKGLPHDNEEFKDKLLTSKVVLYLHGGGYVVCNRITHRLQTFVFVQNTNAIMLVIDYRKIPEVKMEGVINDALESYDFLLNLGVDPSQISLAGDSAGGGLCINLCKRLQALNRHEHMPRSLVLCSPWVDILAQNDIDKRPPYHPYQKLDYIQPQEKTFMKVTKIIVENDKKEATDPLLSPLYHDLTGLPPCLIAYGEFESFRGQIEDFGRKLQECNVPFTMHNIPNMVHVPYLWAPYHRPAKDYFKETGPFLADPIKYIEQNGPYHDLYANEIPKDEKDTISISFNGKEVTRTSIGSHEKDFISVDSHQKDFISVDSHQKDFMSVGSDHIDIAKIEEDENADHIDITKIEEDENAETADIVKIEEDENAETA